MLSFLYEYETNKGGLILFALLPLCTNVLKFIFFIFLNLVFGLKITGFKRSKFDFFPCKCTKELRIKYVIEKVVLCMRFTTEKCFKRKFSYII